MQCALFAFLVVVVVAVTVAIPATYGQEDICTLPADPGPCLAAAKRFFYNEQTGVCEEFIYGGCLGNANNFNTMEECEARCPVPKPPTPCNPWTEEFSSCASLCQPTCDSVTDPVIPCPFACVPGCVCKSGFIRSGRRWFGNKPRGHIYNSSSEFGPCIPEKFCLLLPGPHPPPDPIPPSTDPPIPPVPPFPPVRPGYCNPLTEKWSSCGTMCPETCLGNEADRPCPLVCVPGCVCKPGFVRAGRRCGNKAFDPSCNQPWSDDVLPVGTSPTFLFGPCIPKAWCNVTFPPIDRCPFNEHYEECGTACPETCLTLGSKVPCPLICQRGCFCNEGFVRAGQAIGYPVPHIPSMFPSKDVGSSHGLGPCVPIFQCSLYIAGPCWNLPDGFYIYNFRKMCTAEYFTCLSGRYARHSCLPGMSFDVQSNICKPTQCVPACGGPIGGCGILKKKK